MSIVLSASVRQNLLSLQSTAELLSTTQNRLSTGKKVNTALDNPTNFFTASALDSRASDINNLLDGIGNGVQVLQAANTGITSLQKLVDSAKSVANQALQTPSGYSQKSTVTTAAIAGATADNLLGTGAPADATFVGANSGTAHTDGTVSGTLTQTDGNDITMATVFDSSVPNGLASVRVAALSNQTLVVNGVNIFFDSAATSTSGSVGAGFTIGLAAGSTSTFADLFASIDAITGNNNPATASRTYPGGFYLLHTGTANDIDTTGSGPTVLMFGLGLMAPSATRGSGGLTNTTELSAVIPPFAAGNTLTVNGQTLTFMASGASGANQINVGDTVGTLLSKIDGLSGGSGSSISGGAITLHTGTASDLTITSSNAAAFNALGFTGGGVTQARAGSSGLANKTLTIGATGGGTATNITFGTGAGQVDTLNELNAALSGNNLQATVSSDGKISITTSNDAASSTIGTVGGTAAGAGQAFNGLTAAAPVADAAAQLTRANLVNQYNNIINQITTTAQDASFNGVNLLGGDTLKLVFNETGKSTLSITGVNFNPAGLGLSTLASGTDFIDNAATNKVLSSLTNASGTLRSQASTLGSNLSIVQIRQDFSKNLINVLQTGSSNLTLADTNEEAANSQALSTRQSIAVSALSLANQSQQSVLQLLR